MINTKWKNILQREIIILAVCLVFGIGLAIAGRIVGGERNSGQIFIFAICVFSGLTYFLIQSIRAIGWSILNLLKN